MIRSRKAYEPFSDGSINQSTGRWPILFQLDQDSRSRYSLKLSTVVQLLLFARLVSAFFNNIHDCDETFNYLEPIHFLLHDSGLQTWEYSPVYAIRSYAYLWLYAGPLWLLNQFVQIPPLLSFYLIRFGCAMVCAVVETYFYSGICKQFGSEVGRLTLKFQIFSPALFIASNAILPSTFSMYATLVAYAAYLHRHHRISILACGCSVLLGWPFAALLKLPILMDLLISRKRFYFIKWGILVASFLLISLLVIDSYYYGKLVLAPLNIVLYNVFTSHGANLYGTEPWTFYARNLLLNFNVAFVAAILAPLLFLLVRQSDCSPCKIITRQSFAALSAFLIWLTIFFIQAHKEERFLFPVYPLIALLSAFTLVLIRDLVLWYTPVLRNVLNALFKTFFIIFVVMSTSRVLALYFGYHAPLNVFAQLSSIHNDERIESIVNVCVAKEWHRFPSSFFLPDNRYWKLRFVESEFRGQLPQPFLSGIEGSRTIRSNFNDLNQEETDRYWDPMKCDYMVDSDYSDFSNRDRPYSKMKDIWSVVYTSRFLDVSKSSPLFRAFYVPFLSERFCTYIDYNLLKNRRLYQINLQNGL